jgi:hypothetical protein
MKSSLHLTVVEQQLSDGSIGSPPGTRRTRGAALAALLAVAVLALLAVAAPPAAGSTKGHAGHAWGRQHQAVRHEVRATVRVDGGTQPTVRHGSIRLAAHPKHGKHARQRKRGARQGVRIPQLRSHGRTLSAAPPPAVDVPVIGPEPGQRVPLRVHHMITKPAAQPPVVHRVAGTPPPAKSDGGALAPLQRLGYVITHATGISVFSGRRGWLYAAALLVALGMIATGLTGAARRR